MVRFRPDPAKPDQPPPPDAPILVRQATLRDGVQLQMIVYSGDLAARVEWYARQKPGWSDTIDDASFDAIFRVGNTLALPTLERLRAINKIETETLGSLIPSAPPASSPGTSSPPTAPSS